jgi:D-aminoacyl-tRNA deacylase
MRAVVQRVIKASVVIDSKVFSAINKGLLVFLGIEDEDSLDDVKWLSKKINQLRIFNDSHGVMNYSVGDIEGEFMVISQFTLHASTKNGNRPSYIKASKADHAQPLYNTFVQQLTSDSGSNIMTGRFGAEMKVDLINDGPVTIFIDTKNKE